MFGLRKTATTEEGDAASLPIETEMTAKIIFIILRTRMPPIRLRIVLRRIAI